MTTRRIKCLFQLTVIERKVKVKKSRSVNWEVQYLLLEETHPRCGALWSRYVGDSWRKEICSVQDIYTRQVHISWCGSTRFQLSHSSLLLICSWVRGNLELITLVCLPPKSTDNKISKDQKQHKGENSAPLASQFTQKKTVKLQHRIHFKLFLPSSYTADILCAGKNAFLAQCASHDQSGCCSNNGLATKLKQLN